MRDTNTKVQQPDLFISSVWNNDNDMRIVDVVYDDYALVHTVKTKDGVSEVLNKLYSKSGSVTQDIECSICGFRI